MNTLHFRLNRRSALRGLRFVVIIYFYYASCCFDPFPQRNKKQLLRYISDLWWRDYEVYDYLPSLFLIAFSFGFNFSYVFFYSFVFYISWIIKLNNYFQCYWFHSGNSEKIYKYIFYNIFFFSIECFKISCCFLCCLSFDVLKFHRCRAVLRIKTLASYIKIRIMLCEVSEIISEMHYKAENIITIMSFLH